MPIRFIVIFIFSLTSVAAFADYYKPFTYDVTITNLTRGQTFRSQLMVTHNHFVELFDLGQPATA